MKKFLLKWKLKRLYIRIQEYPMYNCGHSMQMNIDNTYFNLVQRYNKTADRLFLIDPKCPKFRYIL